MLSNKAKLLSLAICLSVSKAAIARSGLTINGGEGAVNPLTDMSVAGATQRTTTNTYTMRFRASCFRTNLRGVANPVSPSSTIVMLGNISIDNKPAQPFSIKFPSSAVLAGNTAETADGVLTADIPAKDYSMPAGSVAGYSGNMIMAKIKTAAISSIDPVTAKISVAQQRFKVSNVRFEQIIPGTAEALAKCDAQYAAQKDAYDKKMKAFGAWFKIYQGKFGDQYVTYAKKKLDRELAQCKTRAQGAKYSFYGINGPMSTSAININQSSDGKTYDIETGFPGQEGFCGGYHSPLMVFLDSKIPKFNSVVDFDMGHGLKTFWPEKNHSGYLVALPKNGKVTTSNELFGESSEFKNGFEKLALHDINKDGVIDSKDPVFKKLVLWKDSTGKGLYKKKDSVPLAQIVKSINLNYRTSITQVSPSAEFRERSTIVLAKPSKYKEAYIVDVWFRPSLGTDNTVDLPKLTSK